MSILNGKNIIVPESEAELLSELSTALLEAQAIVTRRPLSQLTLGYVESQKVDILFLDFVHDAVLATDLLKSLQAEDDTRSLIVIALIKDDSSSSVNEVLSSGAADYLLATETVEEALVKITTLLGQPDRFSGSHMIDITPDEVHVSRANIKVFVVEDDSLLRNLLSNKLEQSHFAFTFSEDGVDVCEKVISSQSNIIILDLMLPGISGLEILEQLKNDEETKSIPVIIFSNRDEQSDRRRANELGVVGFYVKAMTDLSELMEIIEAKAT